MAEKLETLHKQLPSNLEAMPLTVPGHIRSKWGPSRCGVVSMVSAHLWVHLGNFTIFGSLLLLMQCYYYYYYYFVFCHFLNL